MAEKNRYSDEELEEFRQIINEKLEVAQRDYDALKASLMNADNNSTDDTSPTYKVLEEGANTLSKEETTRLAQRQMKLAELTYGSPKARALFKEMMNTTFVGYVNELRLNHAALLLVTTDSPIIEIASKSGFNNLSNFNRAFKMHFGKTPSAYRKG